MKIGDFCDFQTKVTKDSAACFSSTLSPINVENRKTTFSKSYVYLIFDAVAKQIILPLA